MLTDQEQLSSIVYSDTGCLRTSITEHNPWLLGRSDGEPYEADPAPTCNDFCRKVHSLMMKEMDGGPMRGLQCHRWEMDTKQTSKTGNSVKIAPSFSSKVSCVNFTFRM